MSFHQRTYTWAKSTYVVGLAFVVTAVRWRSLTDAAIGVLFMIAGYVLACEANSQWRFGWQQAFRLFRLEQILGEDKE